MNTTQTFTLRQWFQRHLFYGCRRSVAIHCRSFRRTSVGYP